MKWNAAVDTATAIANNNNSNNNNNNNNTTLTATGTDGTYLKHIAIPEMLNLQQRRNEKYVTGTKTS